MLSCIVATQISVGVVEAHVQFDLDGFVVPSCVGMLKNLMLYSLKTIRELQVNH